MKKVRLFLLLLMVAMLPLAMFGQTRALGYAEIGTGTSSSNYAPISTYYKYSYTLSLYFANEVSGVFGTDGIAFTSIAFEYTHSTTQEYPIAVYMGNTNRATMSASDGLIPVADMTKVFEGNITFTAGWVEIPLTTPFEWDGTSNIVIAVNATLGSDIGSASSFKYTSTTSTSVLYVRNDNSGAYDPDTETPTISSYNYTSYRPNVRIYGNIACETIDGLSVGNITSSGAVISWNALQEASSVDLAYGTDEENLTTVEAITSTTYPLADLTANTNYIVKVRANCGNDTYGSWAQTSFTTNCNAEILDATHPFHEDFTGMTSSTFPPECWKQERTAVGTGYGTDYPDGAWTISTSSQGTGSTPPMAQLRDSKAGSTHNLVITPLSMVAGNYIVSLRVYRAASGTTATTEGVNVYVSKTSDLVSEGNDAVDLGFISRNYTVASTVNAGIIGAESATGWYTYELPFNAATDGVYYVIFEGRNQYSSSTYMDDIAVFVAPNCLKPTDVALVDGALTATSAKISWTDNTENPLSYLLLVNDEEVVADENPFNLPNLTPETRYTVKVKAVCTETDTSDWSDASVTFTTPATCPAPTTLTYSNLTATSVTLDWTVNGEETQWILVLNGQEILVNEKPLTIDTLTEQTPYTAIIRAFCSADDTSANSNTARFTTKCGATVVTNNIPFEEDFNSITTGIPQCWDNSEGTTTSASYKWTYYATGATGHCVRFDSYSNSNGNTNMLKTPVLDLTNVTDPKLSFNYKNPAGGDFSVFVSTDGGQTYTTSLAIGLTGVSSWSDTTIVLENLESYNQVVIVFRGTSNYGSDYSGCYIFLDDVVVGGTPTCVAPDAVSVPDSTITTTTAIVHWNDNNENDPANGWIILVNDEEVVADANPFTLPNLTPSTSYTVKVKANCGTDDESTWSEEVSFATACAAVATLDENFDNWSTNRLPVCWQKVGTTGTVAINTGTGNAAPHTTPNNLKFSGTTNNNIVALPEIESYEGKRMTFYTKPENNSNSSCGTFEVGYITDLDSVNSFQALQPAYNYNDADFANGYCKKTVYLSNVPANARLAFNHKAGSSSWYWFVDDVVIEEAPACLEPTALNVDTVTATSVTLTWVDQNTERPESWTVSYSNSDTTIEANATDTTITIGELVPETAYTAKVKANCGSEWSAVVNFTTPATCPAPTNLTYSDLTATSVTLDWIVNGEETQWILILNGQEIEVNTKPLTIDTLTEQTPYTAILRAFCAADDTSYNSNTARFVTPCAPQTAEGYIEDFSGYTAANGISASNGVLPDCWNYIGTSGSYRPHVYNGSYAPTASDNSLVMTAGTSSYGGSPNFAVMPVFDNLYGKMLTFATSMESATSGHLTVGYVTDLTAASFVKLDSIPNNYYNGSDRYVTHEVIVTSVPAGARIAFKWEQASTWYSCAIDDIAIVDMPACVKPIAVTAAASTITATSAVIAWTDQNLTAPEIGWTINLNGTDTTVTENPFTFDNLLPETEYTVKVKAICTDTTDSEWSDEITFTTLPTCIAPSAVSIPASTITTTSAVIQWTDNNEDTPEYGWTINLNGVDTTVTENPFTFDNLAASTLYTVKVKANCDADDESAWSSTVTFRTECGDVTVEENNPFEDGFEDYNANSFPACWTLDVSYVGYSTYPYVYSYGANSGSKLLYMYFSGASAMNLVSTPTFTNEMNTLQVTFYARYSSYNPLFVVGVMDGTTFEPVDTIELTSIYADYTVRFNNYTGNGSRIAFKASPMGSSTYGYVYLDDVTVELIPSCIRPDGIEITGLSTTTATIDWTDNNEIAPQSWTISLNGTETTVTEHPYTFDNLTAATLYTVKVKANCTDSDESDWSNEEIFGTDCEVMSAVGYSEDFSSYTAAEEIYNEGVMPLCWSMIYTGSSNDQAPHVSNDSYYLEMDGNFLSMLAGAASYGAETYVVMPEFDNVNGMHIDFNYVYESTSYGTLTFGYLTDATVASSYNVIGTLSANASVTAAGYDLQDIPDGARLAFMWTVSGAYSWYSCGIDDIVLTGEPVVVDSCATPTNVAVNNNVVTWTGDAVNYNVQITVAGVVVIDTTVNTTSFTIEGLENGTHASVSVQAVCDEDDLSEWSEAVEFDYIIEGINNYAIRANIYPNPTTGNVTVESDAINADITVYDMFGKKMMTSKVASERTELDFSRFAPGVYTIRIANANATTTIKVVKE